ncbi:NAD(P)-dependent oxidoreductase [Paracoccus sp. SCSIO 75233]|uniref:NAD(P)-dependent oxidoreductase n=1 Tax=Paracoccus sp. SCSIO 75233 TaxID=3017782 RepID=UPI0022F04887|nr:NAD(P)-dependent oxidoreductase [Paracoccus sp. SCSIO 75233]WBU52430.1 NAD(P)-dependent oxidoreductase [Paracoccus sp. SCSIO 75233]
MELEIALNARKDNAMKNAMKVGFVGLGSMGRGMVANLQKAGYQLVVNDLSQAAAVDAIAAGAMWAETPREVAEDADLVFTSLPMPADVQAVSAGTDGLIAGLSEGKVWVDTSTNDLDVIRELHGILVQKKVYLLDAPIGGSPHNTVRGDIIFWVGGEERAFQLAKPALDAISENALFVGECGSGTITKLVQNMFSLALLSVQIECLSMGVKAGVDMLPLWKALRQGRLGQMRTFDLISAGFLPNKLDPAKFFLKLAEKDARLALQIGRSNRVPMKLCSAVHQDMLEALNRGWEMRDAQSFLELQMERSGLPPSFLTQEEVDAVKEST